MSQTYRKILALRQYEKEWGQKGSFLAHPLFLLKTLPRQDAEIRYGIVVKKKIGTAVMRNKIKRRLRAALQNIIFHGPMTCIIIVKNADLATCDFRTLSLSLNSLIINGKT